MVKRALRWTRSLPANRMLGCTLLLMVRTALGRTTLGIAQGSLRRAGRNCNQVLPIALLLPSWLSIRRQVCTIFWLYNPLAATTAITVPIAATAMAVAAAAAAAAGFAVVAVVCTVVGRTVMLTSRLWQLPLTWCRGAAAVATAGCMATASAAVAAAATAAVARSFRVCFSFSRCVVGTICALPRRQWWWRVPRFWLGATSDVRHVHRQRERFMFPRCFYDLLVNIFCMILWATFLRRGRGCDLLRALLRLDGCGGGRLRMLFHCSGCCGGGRLRTLLHYGGYGGGCLRAPSKNFIGLVVVTQSDLLRVMTK